MVKRTEDTGCDGLELNFGCPHGMSERGMGAAVGQVPEYTTMITRMGEGSGADAGDREAHAQCHRRHANRRRPPSRAAPTPSRLINTINSLMGVDLDTFAPRPTVRGKGSHGGYCGPAVKPIALNMVSACAKHVKIPVSGIGGIATWRDAAEFITLRRDSVQVCTAAMHYGFRIVEDMVDGLAQYLDDHGFKTIERSSRARIAQRGGLGRSRFELQDHRGHQSRAMHRLPPLLYRLRGWRASVDRAVFGSRKWEIQRERKRRSRAANHGRRLRGVQFMHVGLSGGKLHHDEARG